MNEDLNEVLRRRDGPIHGWFALSYAAYLILPRLQLSSLPVDLQQRLINLLNEIETKHGVLGPVGQPNYTVTRRGLGGKIVSDPWRDYRHGSPAQARKRDVEIDGEPV